MKTEYGVYYFNLERHFIPIISYILSSRRATREVPKRDCDNGLNNANRVIVQCNQAVREISQAK